MTDPPKAITYEGCGVSYQVMDLFKIAAQASAKSTASNIQRLGYTEYEPSRGESVYLIESSDQYLAHVEEGLGTKVLVADAMMQLTGNSHYSAIAQDTVAMIVNDMVTLGALPLSVAMHLAVGNSNWFHDDRRCQDLADGWRVACNLAGAIWGGGETPTLKGIVTEGTCVLSGSAIGVIKPKDRLIKGDIQDRDVIILLTASGVHANGLTMCRSIADILDQSCHTNGYLQTLVNGRTYGEALLDPTPIYVPHVAACLDAGIRIHYGVHITGHGWRKLMRHPGGFSYFVNTLPPQLPILDFIQKYGSVTSREMFGTFNMGAGFALYVSEADASRAVNSINAVPQQGVRAFCAGHVEASAERRVVITPVNLTFEASSLEIR